MTRTRQVLAVDPGGTSGIALWSGGDTPPPVEERNPYETIEIVERWLQRVEENGVVVVERFTIGPQTLKNSRQYDAIEIIGALRYLSLKHGAEFVLQAPADAKRLMTNDVLRRLGWYVTGRDHGRDALRHLGLYLISRRWLDPSLLL